jgi:hypothetical protein
MNGIALLEKGQGRDLLRKICLKHKVPIRMVEELVKAELEQVGKLRKRGLSERFTEIIDDAVVTPAENEGE